MVIPVLIQIYYKCLKHKVHTVPQSIWSSNQAEQSLKFTPSKHESWTYFIHRTEAQSKLSLRNWKVSFTRRRGTNKNNERTLAHSYIEDYKLTLPKCLYRDKSWETSSFSASQNTSFSFLSLLCLYEPTACPCHKRHELRPRILIHFL